VDDWPEDVPLFTGDDYQLVTEAVEREYERIRLFCEVNHVLVDPDDQIPRLTNLAARLRIYLDRLPQGGAPDQTT
jgi:hypothetical protein